MNFARRVFQVAGIYGLLVLLPQYFLESKVGRDFPPAVTHPEYFYGFVGVAVAWQIAFLVIASDPGRYRPIMIAAVFEKASFGIAAPLLFAQGRTGIAMLAAAAMDLVLGTLFLVAYFRTRTRAQQDAR